MTPTEQAQIVRGFQALGVHPSDLQAVLEQADYATCKKKLAELKDKVKKSFRKVVLLLHPDVNGGDAEKTELFKVVCRIKEDIEKLSIQQRQPAPIAPPPPPPVPFVVVVMHHPMRGVPGVGRPPPGHPAANGNLRNWAPNGPDRAQQTVTMHPFGVYPRRGT